MSSSTDLAAHNLLNQSVTKWLSLETCLNILLTMSPSRSMNCLMNFFCNKVQSCMRQHHNVSLTSLCLRLCLWSGLLSSLLLLQLPLWPLSCLRLSLASSGHPRLLRCRHCYRPALRPLLCTSIHSTHTSHGIHRHTGHITACSCCISYTVNIASIQLSKGSL